MKSRRIPRTRRVGAAPVKRESGAPPVGVVTSHGHELDSGFREAFARAFGRPPDGAWAADCVVVQALASPVGPLVAAATSAALCALEFGVTRVLDEQAERLTRIAGGALVPGTNALLQQLAAELEEYFAGRRRAFGVPLRVTGTEFQRRVWRELRRIPYGRTMSYGELARRIGRPGAQRAVGQANHRNPIAIVIPCHRVVSVGGKLGGYGGGLWRKQYLLELERGLRD